MDLAIDAKDVFVMMTLFGKDGSPKLVPSCTYPLTGVGCFSRVYTDHGVFQVGEEGPVVLSTDYVSVGELEKRLGLRLQSR